VSSKIYIGPTENRVCENAFLIGGWAGEGDKHLGHNHRRHHQHQYHRHVVAPAKSLDARKHAPPAVSSISSSVSGSLRSRSPPRRVLPPSPFRPRSSFLFISRHHLLSLALHPALPPRRPPFLLAPPSPVGHSSSRSSVNLLFCRFSISSFAIVASSSPVSVPRCLLLVSVITSRPPRALAYSRLAVREGSRPVRRLIYESHASNPVAPWGYSERHVFLYSRDPLPSLSLSLSLFLGPASHVPVALLFSDGRTVAVLALWAPFGKLNAVLSSGCCHEPS